MTGGKDIRTGTSTEHKDAPCRTDTDCVASRDEQPTLPDGIGSVYPAADEVIVSTDSDAESRTDSQLAEPTLRAPFSGFWFENADIDEAEPDETEIRTRLYSQLVSGPTENGPEVTTHDSMPRTEYIGPELDAAPRFVDETEFDATPLSAIAAEVSGSPGSGASRASLRERSTDSAQPTELSDEDVGAAVAELVEELSDLLDGEDASGTYPEDSRRDELLIGPQTGAASQLLDADDDDLTDPQVPSARRNSERPTPLVAEPREDAAPAESVVPLAVSVTVRPTEQADKQDSEQRAVASRRLWLPAAIAVGVAAAAAGLVLVAASLPDSDAADRAARAAHMAVDPPAANRAAPQPRSVSNASSSLTPTVVEQTRSALPHGLTPAVVEQGHAAVESPSTVPMGREPTTPPSLQRSSSLSIAEQMRLAAREQQEVPRPDPGASEHVTTGLLAAAPDPSADQPPSVVDFDRAAAHAALADLAANAASCRQPGDPTGQARIAVTFSPTTGRATQAIVSGKPFQGTAIGGCIARVARQAAVPPYTGTYVTVSKTISIR